MFDGGAAGLHRMIDDRCQFDGFAAELELAAADAAHIQQVVNEAHYLRDLTLQHLGDWSHLLLIAPCSSQNLHRVTDRRERVA